MSKFKIVTGTNGSAILTAYIKGRVFTLTSRNPHFDQVADALRADDQDRALALSESGKAILKELRKVTKRFKVDRSGNVSYKGTALPAVLTDHLADMIRHGDTNYLAFARALDRIAANPSANARESLHRWMQNGNLSFDARGYLVAYKGLTTSGLSIHSGTAYVNGEKVDGQIPNKVGSVITMPREEVDPDTNVACSYGLHIGTYDYAHSFGYMLALVAVDPADIVSVPLDCESSKIRACRYEVVAHLDKPEPIGSTFYGDPDPYALDDEDDWDDEGGEDWDDESDDWIW